MTSNGTCAICRMMAASTEATVQSALIAGFATGHVAGLRGDSPAKGMCEDHAPIVSMLHAAGVAITKALETEGTDK